jgi:hypothetical protein
LTPGIVVLDPWAAGLALLSDKESSHAQVTGIPGRAIQNVLDRIGIGCYGAGVRY